MTNSQNVKRIILGSICLRFHINDQECKFLSVAFIAVFISRHSEQWTLVYHKVLICIHFVFVPVSVFMIPSTLNNEHLSSKSPQMHQLVSELKCSGKVLHHNWKYISTKQTFNRGSFSWATLNPVFGNVLRWRNTSGVSHSAYLSGKAKYIVVGCWSQPWGRTQTQCVWLQNT